ncbi:L-alanine-DL-glutamate epimerase-like enolase superfamily enzyme [Nitrospirillum amazonense]|uniref:Dipeptide epimerase n=1 Tax=Nitrospirillum amazonense TaxID=28077 RepID=A0A560J3Z6_9PROT|nr:N-acetyl-D-Glu racemase DgcA [Nitrospirillum amazonense]TWB65826.1 L-alanine-DL-glutamate epimerase-like enolase superfamily enzyme [Nitrospirillum amazonense]
MPSSPMPSLLTVHAETFPIRGTFRISRGAKTEAHVVVAEVTDGAATGRGECVPYARYGETVAGVVTDLEALTPAVAAGLTRTELQRLLPPGAARNALDCALWDLEAKRTGVPAWRLAGLAAAPGPLATAFTLSVDTPEAMAAAARAAAHYPLLKLKLTGEGDLDRVAAVRENAPHARLIVDANEGWSLEQLDHYAPALAALGVELLEQPLPAGRDADLAGYQCPIPLGADESVHGLDSLEALVGRYQVANIKLDKTGGLTEALALKAACEAAGLRVMVGCMVATSLSMAPAHLLAQGAAFVDLDGPLLLARDRMPGLRYEGATADPPSPALWG